VLGQTSTVSILDTDFTRSTSFRLH